MIYRIKGNRKRQVLQGMLKLIVIVILLAIAWVSVSFFSTTSDSKGALPQFSIALAEMKEDHPIIFTWNQRPVLVMKRSKELIDSSLQLNTELLRFGSDIIDGNPVGLKGRSRSHRLDIFVVYSSGTDFGCPIEFIAANEEIFLNAPWPGGFQDTCRGSRYDLGGRVYIEQYAEKNLQIPPYIVKSGTIVLGLVEH